MKALPTVIRAACALLLAAMLALRVSASAGLMPGLDHGRPAIVACPDAEVDAPLALATPAHEHRHGNDRHAHAHAHAPCPYAAASWLSFVVTAGAPLLALLSIAFVLVAAMDQTQPASPLRYLRPPAIGPPIPALV